MLVGCNVVIGGLIGVMLVKREEVAPEDKEESPENFPWRQIVKRG